MRFFLSFLPLGKTCLFYIPTTPLPRGCAVPTTALVDDCLLNVIKFMPYNIIAIYIEFEKSLPIISQHLVTTIGFKGGGSAFLLDTVAT